jgi:hypothetical protein
MVAPFRLDNRASSPLTLKSATYGASSSPPGGAEALPATILAHDTFGSNDLAPSFAATYTNARGASLDIACSSTPAGDAWQTSNAKATPGSTNPAFVGPLEASLGVDAYLDLDSGLYQVTVFDLGHLRIENATTSDLVLTSTDHRPDSQADTPPLAIAAGKTVDFKMRMWPKGFANYALKDTDWSACWILIWWDEYGSASARVQVSGLQNLDVTSTIEPAALLVQRFTVTARAVSIPIAPSNGAFQMSTTGPGKPPDPTTAPAGRKVLGIDVSGYQKGMDWGRAAKWVDPAGRRIWFAYAKCSEGKSVDGEFAAYWDQLSSTRFFRGAYHYVRPLDVGDSATPGQIDADASAQADAFMRGFTEGGGWRQYDLPPMIDFEFSTYELRRIYNRRYASLEPSGKARPTDQWGAWHAQTALRTQFQVEWEKDAWTMLPAIRRLVISMGGAFGVMPFLYMGAGYFGGWYSAAKLGFQRMFPRATWDDAALAPLFDCMPWPPQFSPSHSPDGAPSWPPARPPGYSGAAWFPEWKMWQWGITAERRAPAPPGGLAPTTGPAMGAPSSLDQDVWNGELDDLAALAARTRWNR